MQLTYFGANSWFLEVGQLRILLDPWLVDSLTFGGQRWFFEVTNRYQPPIPRRIDLILLSQGLPDHAHRPTLEQLDRTIPVIGSASAAKLASQLGYTQVTTLKPGQGQTLGKGLEIRALAGAPVPQVENGYLLSQRRDGRKLYYEPHGFAAPELVNYGPVDVVISPVVNISLPLAGPIVKGKTTALGLAQQLKPHYFLPTAAGGDVDYTGILDRILTTEGSVAAFKAQVSAAGLATQVLDPKPGRPYGLRFPPAQRSLPGQAWVQWLQGAKT
ncbi:MBL fold metallo-hydrolase [Prochlorothrix hollandica]|uniref:Zn-dependent hydrolase n=1 Tax=Prochlorothrix hollandica PCC 9006 = CALU 1027 TaxID=317619 RepID=A0A0M2PVN5_PROHO|nr:MBL fold metallo-hydrolase [Prochlorothrix hollandica]KKJ00225.1 Zn-dependent hydrolase [Prochlorothrix hollandica PCC 9006 = CALU 1027]